MSERRNNNAPHRGPGGRGMMAGDKAKNFKGTIAKLIRYMRPFYLQIVIIVLFVIGSTIFGIICSIFRNFTLSK